MFRIRYTHCFFSILLIMGSVVNGVIGQIQEHEVPGIRKQAMEKFEVGDFAAAEYYFNKLSDRFPGDPLYRYYRGICKVEQNDDLKGAVELLYFAASRGVPEDVLYYMGEAHRKMYDFKKAREYYLEFDRVAPRSMTKERDSKFLIRSINSAMKFTSSFNPYEVINVTFMNFQDPEQFGQIKMKGGTLSLKPEDLFREEEERDDLNSLMFIPENLHRGEYVYFSGLDKRGKGGFQIMQARKGANGKLIDVEAVNDLNSDGDEILPYYDPVGKDIYFASDGREGLGGFDLFKAHYDENRKAWSEPVHLGFPVNSVFDDYLLLPGTDLGKVIFFSARQATDSTVAVYRVHLSEPKKSLARYSPSQIQQIANLGDVASEALGEFEMYRASAKSEDAKRQVSAKTGSVQQNTTVSGKKPEVVDADYQSLISNALKHQSASDSLVELATTARMKVRESDDPNDRWLYQKQILVWDKKAAEEKDAADRYFAQVSKYEKEKLSDAIPGTIEKDKEINDITVYKYTEVDSISKKAQTAFQTPGSSVEVASQENDAKPVKQEAYSEARVQEDKLVQGSDIFNNFEILDFSPYTTSDPIPINTALPGGTFYRIQLGVYSRLVEPATFGGLMPITGEIIPERNLTKYFVGQFNRYEDVQKALAKVRGAGYNDAFVVAWYNGNSMSIDKARKLEK